MFPAVSFAFTVKVCDPSGVAAKVFGLVQAAKAPASSLHWKPPEIVSLALKAKSGVVSLVGSTGFVPRVIVGASRVDRPGVTGGTALVARRIDGLDVEAVRPVGEARVGLGARARNERATVQLALEGDAGLAIGEPEARAAAVARICRSGADRGRGRRCQVDRPRVGGGGARVTQRVGRSRLERMGARKKRPVALGARAGAESASVELALERARRLARGEAERRAGQVGGVQRRLVDGHYRNGRVDRPRVARAARVPGCIGAFRRETVRPVRKP